MLKPAVAEAWVKCSKNSMIYAVRLIAEWLEMYPLNRKVLGLNMSRSDRVVQT